MTSQSGSQAVSQKVQPLYAIAAYTSFLFAVNDESYTTRVTCRILFASRFRYFRQVSGERPFGRQTRCRLQHNSLSRENHRRLSASWSKKRVARNHSHSALIEQGPTYHSLLWYRSRPEDFTVRPRGSLQGTSPASW